MVLLLVDMIPRDFLAKEKNLVYRVKRKAFYPEVVAQKKKEARTKSMEAWPARWAEETGRAA